MCHSKVTELARAHRPSAEVLIGKNPLLISSHFLLFSFSQGFSPAAVNKLSTDVPTQRGTERLARKISFLILGTQQYQPKFSLGPHLGVGLQ